jgi:hypothetical protein
MGSHILHHRHGRGGVWFYLSVMAQMLSEGKQEG